MYRICSCKLLFWWSPLGTPPWNKNQVDVILRNHGLVGGVCQPNGFLPPPSIILYLWKCTISQPNGHPPFAGSSCELGKLTTKKKGTTNKGTTQKNSQQNCADWRSYNSKLFLRKRGYTWWFGVALSVALSANPSVINDLDGWVDGFYVSQKSARFSHGLRLSCTCFMMECRRCQSLAWFYIVISFLIGFSDHRCHRHNSFPTLGLMNLHYCNRPRSYKHTMHKWHTSWCFQPTWK